MQTLFDLTTDQLDAGRLILVEFNGLGPALFVDEKQVHPEVEIKDETQTKEIGSGG